jgi:hypothetical protein
MINIMILYIALLHSCAPLLYIPTISNITDPSADINELKKGRLLYVKQCGSCHELYLPQKYTPDDWRWHMDRMQTKAKITEEEKDMILKYLHAAPKAKVRK